MDAANVVRSARLGHLPTERVSDSYARRVFWGPMAIAIMGGT